ncbi:MAG: methyltransferase domain-containing protein [Thermochromatium sp.]
MHPSPTSTATPLTASSTAAELVAAIAQALDAGDIARLKALTDAAYDARQYEQALAALDALEALGVARSGVFIAKRAQILIQTQRSAQAIALLEPYVEQHPDDDTARALLANALAFVNHKAKAVEHLRVLVQRQPQNRQVLRFLAVCLEESGRRAEADRLLERLLAAQPEDWAMQLCWVLAALDRAPGSLQAQRAMRKRFEKRIAALNQLLLRAKALPATPQAFMTAMNSGPFALAYLPEDITAPIRAWGKMLVRLLPPVAKPLPPPRPRLKLALISAYLRRHSVWLILLQSLIKGLDRRFFELVACYLGAQQDDQTRWLRRQVDGYFERSDDWPALIMREAPDALFYPDTCMDSRTVGLAAQRLAPLQVTTWGHPVTSGLANVDLYLSGELLEPDDAAAHYTERLILLPGTGACTPKINSDRQPLPPACEALFADGRPVALVPCHAFKLIPSDDELWIAIARRYPKLRLVFFAQSNFGDTGTKPHERIRAAFAAAGLDYDEHAALVPHQPSAVFHTLLERAVLYLDGPSFSGYTTAWQGVFCGTPIVTLEGRFLRQRLAAGLMRAIGITDTIAQDRKQYLALIGRLIDEWQNDPTAYAARRARIQAAAPLACDDVRVVRAFERVLLEELAARGNETAQRLLPQHRAAYPDYAYDPTSGRVHAPPRHANPEPPSMTAMTPQPTPEASAADAAPAAATAAAAPASAAALPAWALLERGLHLQTLSHSYAPVGLLEMIPAVPQQVFDLGCFVGGTGRWLKARYPGVRVVGAELLPEAAAKARQIYDEVWEGRFEEMDLSAHAGRFDTIIAADVLEHLYHPWQALLRLKTLLAPGGQLYVSLPNVRNLRVLNGLLEEGDWPYAGAGILDITHIRFFTRKSALRMLTETGFEVLEVRANLDAQLKPLLAGKDLGQIRNVEQPHWGMKNLGHEDVLELFTLQWFLRCRPVPGGP